MLTLFVPKSGSLLVLAIHPIKEMSLSDHEEMDFFSVMAMVLAKGFVALIRNPFQQGIFYHTG